MFTRVCREGNGCRYAASVGRKSFTRYHSSGGEIDFVRRSATENHRALLQTVCCKSCLDIAQQPTASKQHCTSLLIFSLRFNGHFSSLTWVSQYQNVSILDFFGAVDDGDGGDNWIYKTCRGPARCVSFFTFNCINCK